MTRALAATLFAALVLIPAAGTHGIKEGGTFRVAAPTGWFGAIDPALTTSGVDATALIPACGTLLAYPDKALPEGLRLTPELAVSHPTISKDRRTYTFTIRKDARFSTGTAVTARDFVHALERIFSPSMQSDYAEAFEGILGARKMLAGKTTKLAGAVANGRTLVLKLVGPVPDFPARLSLLCVVPHNLPADPEGAKAPIPSAGPYFFAEYSPGERVVLERNLFYRGARPHHVDRITMELTADAAALDRVASGQLDWVMTTPDYTPQLPGLVQRYGTNKARLFLLPGLATRVFFLNTSRPLFRNNVKLRQAVNFAVDRRALTREFGQHLATSTDQFLPPGMPGFRDEHVYPLKGPDLAKARALAKGNTRSGKAVLYTCARPDCLTAGEILKQNLRPIGIELEIKQFPTQLLFEKAQTPGEPYDLVWIGWVAAWSDPHYFLQLFDGRTAREPGTSNYSRLNSATFDRLLDRASALWGSARYDAYGELDAMLTRDVAPVIAYANGNSWAFVSARTGCVVMNPYFDLTAVCLK